MTSVQNNPKGILLILIGMAVFSVQDALIKFIYNDSALYELYLGRTLAALFFFILLYEIFKTKNNFKNSLSTFNNFENNTVFLWI